MGMKLRWHFLPTLTRRSRCCRVRRSIFRYGKRAWWYCARRPGNGLACPRLEFQASQSGPAWHIPVHHCSALLWTCCNIVCVRSIATRQAAGTVTHASNCAWVADLIRSLPLCDRLLICLYIPVEMEDIGRPNESTDSCRFYGHL